MGKLVGAHGLLAAAVFSARNLFAEADSSMPGRAASKHQITEVK